MSSPKPLGFAYARFSDPNQAVGDSLRRQGVGPLAWCQANGVELDESLELVDRGKSAYCREGLDEYALGEFIKLIGTRVPVNSFLLIENLDRLSRERPRVAMMLFCQILEKKVHIVQLDPLHVFWHDREDDEAYDLDRANRGFDRAHNDSKLRSKRIGAAWAEKRKNAGRAIVTRRLPGWVRFNEATGKLEAIDERAAVVKAIFAMALDGRGTYQIARELNAQKVPSWRVPTKAFRGKAAAKRWVTATVRGILDSASVTGRYQPMRGSRVRGRPRPQADGPPVENYYPRVVADETFESVRRMRRKYSGRGRRRDAEVDLFAKLLKLPGGRSLTIRRAPKRAAAYVPVGAAIGDGGAWASFSAGVFEAAMLESLAEVKAVDVLPGATSGRKVERLSRRLEELERLYQKVAGKISDPDLFDAFAPKLKGVGAERTKVAAELAEAQLEAKNPASEAWGTFRNLAGAVAAGGTEARERLRSHLRKTVSEITVLVLPPADPPVKGRPRVLVAQVHFIGGRSRLFGINYSSASGEWSSCSSADTKQTSFPAKLFHWSLFGGLDLRDPAQAAEYAQALEGRTGTLPASSPAGWPGRLIMSPPEPKTVAGKA